MKLLNFTERLNLTHNWGDSKFIPRVEYRICKNNCGSIFYRYKEWKENTWAIWAINNLFIDNNNYILSSLFEITNVNKYLDVRKFKCDELIIKNIL
jgi:hypothetical protein